MRKTTIYYVNEKPPSSGNGKLVMIGAMSSREIDELVMEEIHSGRRTIKSWVSKVPRLEQRLNAARRLALRNLAEERTDAAGRRYWRWTAYFRSEEPEP